MITEKPKKRGPKPTGKGTLVGVRLGQDILSKVDALRASHAPVPTRPETIRQILEATFKKMEDKD